MFNVNIILLRKDNLTRHDLLDINKIHCFTASCKLYISLCAIYADFKYFSSKIQKNFVWNNSENKTSFEQREINLQ